ncbi:MAG: hypothetical protein HWD89_09325 [Tenacibaculum sp.]|uniref:hypothetical protein n=1 Tax=Tenacibaculum sp. TaxID=1906242 RepID=UPI001834E178|nr:hypothetical protein [Tenacibaculum sp.]NVK09244.1 hypothetical protein [Tenacibaculum sp.]
MKTITNKLKVALVAVGFLAVGTVSAQTDPTTGANDATKTARTAAAGESIRLIDNKGTIKYMQSNNGITTITSTVAGNRTVTTWQLGGTLTDNTYIAAGTGAEFALDGLELLDATATASTDATDRSNHDDATPGTGFTVLLRDEATGAVKKMLLSDLLQVQGVRVEYPAPADSTANLDITVTDMTATVSLFKVSVYRNGAKLRAGTDYILGAGVVTVQPQALAAPNDYNNWEIYENDIFEIHWIK